METLENIFGVGQNLTAWQMSARAFVTFFITLFLIRIAGMRSIGKKSAFDTIITIMLGAVLSRVIVGASAFFPTVAAGFVIAIVHRLLAMIAVKHKWLEKIIKGQQRQLYSNGKINWDNMHRSSVSESDLIESVRLLANTKSLNDIDEAYIESNGEISIIKKKGES
ncbi:MAG TPA: YetF domain-containing protein [Chitinophagales bacterium]|nr:YetF domain-containing protein [Chitinophagales bacterium]